MLTRQLLAATAAFIILPSVLSGPLGQDTTLHRMSTLAAQQPVPPSDAHRQFIARYCVSCKNKSPMTGGIALDSVDGLERMAAAAREAGVAVGVLIDVNVGQERCGVAPGRDAVALARRVLEVAAGARAGAGELVLRGLMGYEGHAVGIAERPAREAAVRQAMEKLASTARMFREHGLPADRGGTR